MAGFEDWYWWHRGRQTIVRRILARYAPPRASILDVGCGTGATTAAALRFRQRERDRHGARRAATRARARPRGRARLGREAARAPGSARRGGRARCDRAPRRRSPRAARDLARAAPGGRPARDGPRLRVLVELPRRSARPPPALPAPPAARARPRRGLRDRPVLVHHGIDPADRDRRAARRTRDAHAAVPRRAAIPPCPVSSTTRSRAWWASADTSPRSCRCPSGSRSWSWRDDRRRPPLAGR